ncbi:MAG TPA: hypothetical protein VFO85_00350 [Vicinamibacteria bacterium]|nr:hypothetical protein [Vicinamibacteria bacterium]
MSLSVERISLGESDVERSLAAAIAELGAPPDEGWSVSVTASPGGAWEVVLEGAPRRKADHIDWEIVEQGDRARYRKLFQGARERQLDHVRRCVRNLIWESVQFTENPIKSVNPGLAQAFEDVVWDLLRHEDMHPVQIRFGVWREGFDGMRFVCKVEYATKPSPRPRFPWSWWSSLVRTPEDLRNELEKALTARRRSRPASLVLFSQKRPSRPAQRATA